MVDSSERLTWFMRHGKPKFDYENCTYDDFIAMLVGGINPCLSKNHNIDFTALPREIERIYYSPMCRSFETAKLIRDFLELGNDDVKELELLHEVKFDHNIIRREEFGTLENNRRIILKRWYRNQNGSESFNHSFRRVIELDDMLSNNELGEGKILHVTHGWFLRLIDLYFREGKKSGITQEDLLSVEPIQLGKFFPSQACLTHAYA